MAFTALHNPAVCDALRQLRSTLGLTQQGLAVEMNTALTTIARWETSRSPRGRTLNHLARLAEKAQRPDLAAIFRQRGLGRTWSRFAKSIPLRGATSAAGCKRCGSSAQYSLRVAEVEPGIRTTGPNPRRRDSHRQGNRATSQTTGGSRIGCRKHQCAIQGRQNERQAGEIKRISCRSNSNT